MPAADRVGRWLFLKPGEFARAWPFFLVYLVLFAAFSVADGVSLALFVKRVGAAALPGSYAVVAAANLLFIGAYVAFADRLGGPRAFALILGPTAAVFAAVWVMVRFAGGREDWFTVLFVAREVAFTLVLMHFGTYLQDYFTRDELNRVLPVTYAGGRVGGIVGGWLLAQLSEPLGPVNLLPVFAGLCAAALIAVPAVSHWCRHAAAEKESAAAVPEAERAAVASAGGFLRFAWASPVLASMTSVSLLFMVSRWFLNYQYSRFFATAFDSPAEL